MTRHQSHRADSGAELKSIPISFQEIGFFLYASLLWFSLRKHKIHVWEEFGRVSDAEQVFSKGKTIIQRLPQTWAVITVFILHFLIGTCLEASGKSPSLISGGYNHLTEPIEAS